MKTLTGIFPPIPTPFLDGELAPDKLALNIGKWNKTELRGYVVFGSNGESVFLTREEKLRMVAEVKRYASDDKIIIAGTGSESIKETVSLTNEAAGLGADYALVVTPSYYKSAMNHEALVTYYTMVADAVTIPVILYNVPKFTGVDIQAETVAKLAGHPNIAGVKNSTENIRQLIEFVARTSPDFAVIAGTASMLYGGFLSGASGGIVALANIAPDQCVRIQDS
jgi:4-hydroxy-2-oxoglutarate aldolase